MIGDRLKKIDLPIFLDERGCLTVLQGEVPFDIKRIFWITNSDQQRGGHRHMKTRQALCCLNGASIIEIHDGTKVTKHVLNSPNRILLVEPHEWHTMQNQDTSTVLLVFASHDYDKADYIYEPYD